MVSIQDRLVIKSGLWWHAYGTYCPTQINPNRNIKEKYLSHLFNQGTLHFSAGWIKCIAKKSEGKPRLEICPAVVQSYKTGGTTTPCRHIAQWPVFQEIILKLPKNQQSLFLSNLKHSFPKGFKSLRSSLALEDMHGKITIWTHLQTVPELQ